jgi:hypothetical protein
LGDRFHLADAVVGGIVLAAVRSLPNAVAAVDLVEPTMPPTHVRTIVDSNGDSR